MKCMPMIVVEDVPASSRWYQELLGIASGHGGDEFEMLMDGSTVLLMLHHQSYDEHPAIVASEGAVGGGVLLYFSVDDVKPVFERAQAMGADVIDEPHMNEKARSVEFSLRDPDGYAITISRWSG